MTTCTEQKPEARLGEKNQYGVLCLQKTISQRRRSDRSLRPLKKNLGRFCEIVNRFRDAGTTGVISVATKVFVDSLSLESRENGLARDLAEFWTEIEKKGSSPSLLGTQLAGFLEQCIEYGLTSQLTRIMSRIGNYQYLQHTDGHALSNFCATQVKSFLSRDDRGRSVGINFFMKAISSIASTRLESLFDQTIRKLESEDVVLCLGLFLHSTAEGHRHTQRTWLPRSLVTKYYEYMSKGSITTAVDFLGRNPYPEFFAPLQAILRLDEKSTLLPTKYGTTYRQVKEQIRLCEDKIKREEDGRKCEEGRSKCKTATSSWCPLGPKFRDTLRACVPRKHHNHTDPRSSFLTPLTNIPKF